MPTYRFRHKDSGQEQELFMSISKREEFLRDNPDWEQIIAGAFTARVDSLVTNKRESGFRDVLRKIHNRTPGSDLRKMGAI